MFEPLKEHTTDDVRLNIEMLERGLVLLDMMSCHGVLYVVERLFRVEEILHFLGG